MARNHTGKYLLIMMGLCCSGWAYADDKMGHDSHGSFDAPIEVSSFTPIHESMNEQVAVQISDHIAEHSTHIPSPPTYDIHVPDYLSLSQAQALLLKISPKIAADNALIVSNEQRAKASQSLNKPIIYLGATASHLHLDEHINTQPLKNRLSDGINQQIGQNSQTLPINPSANPSVNIGELLTNPLPDTYALDADKTRSHANVTLLWSAYDGQRAKSLTQLLNGMTDESRADADISLAEQYTTLTKRYFQVQLAIKAAFLRSQALQAIKETDYAAQRALDMGLISRLERLEAKKALAKADYENTKALNDAELAMNALQRLMRTPYPIKPTTPLFISTKPIPKLSYFIEQAKQHHPAFAKVSAKYNQAHALHAMGKAGNKPTVNVFMRAELDKNPNWLVGVSANWKLWGGLDQRLLTQSNLAKLHQAEFSQIDINDNIMLLVEKNWQSLKNAQKNYIALASNIEMAEELVRFRRLGFQEGMNTAVEVMQAEANLEKAKTEQAKTANDYVQALADLMQSCGTPLAFNHHMQTADVKLPVVYLQYQHD